MIHGSLLFVGLLIGTSLMNKIPLASLSVILIYTGYKLVNEKLLRQMYHSGISQLIPFLLTLIFVFLTDILTGVALGLIVSLLFVVNKYYKLQKIRVLDKGDEIIFILPSYTTFLSKPMIQKEFVEISEGKNIIFDLSNSKYIDIEIKEIMQDFIVIAKDKHKTVNITDPNNSFCSK
jgi:MFS superfamily sulfate permease-like transporter